MLIVIAVTILVRRPIR